MPVHVLSYDTAHPGDTRHLEAALGRFAPESVRRLALLVKTEGNASVNDFSREYGMLSARQAITRFGGSNLAEGATMLFSTGCEGVISPFGYAFIDVDDGTTTPSGGEKGLVFGGACSRKVAAEEIGTLAHALLVADTVRQGMKDLAIGPDDVQLIIVKTPLLGESRADPAAARITSAFSKAVGALGAALALGEIAPEHVVPEAFDRDHSLFGRRAMVFSSSEGGNVEVLIFANRAGAASDWIIHTGGFSDLLDASGIRRTLEEAGCRLDADGTLADADTLGAAFIKAGIASNGRVRQYRTTIRTSDLDMDKHVRASMSGLAGSILGTCRMFISANTVHQAPEGAGLCAFIVRKAGA
ncbi:hypothetical protein JP75_02060 [Devosia riboflavina]|uniref:Cyclic amide hydrolase n=1 Tax=Devosia riboflavina TaxID=46914 RepID=A0A087M7T5_9HYPH|nr:ring-opening amidohydrolase [Devosia riboflavina]KFL32938.1 hypothetical protein JP75_02060 [Devosia riboflavina]